MRIHALLAFAALVLAAPSEARLINVHLDKDGSRRRKEIVSMGKPVRLPAGETASNVVVFGGSATVDGDVEEDVVVIGGSADVGGRVDGDVVAVMGSVRLSSGARVGGEAVAVGGSLEAAPGAEIEGKRTEVGLGALRNIPVIGDSPAYGALQGWVRHGLLWLRPFPHQEGWAWVVAAAVLAVYALLALLFPGMMLKCGKIMDERPLSAILAGGLGALLVGPLAIVLVMSVVGILALPFLALLLPVAILLGKASAGFWLGRTAGRRAELPVLERPVAAVAAGTVLLLALYAVPVLGLAVWTLAALFGLGAVILAGFEALQSETGGRLKSCGPAAETQLAPEAAAPIAASLPRAGFWPRAGAIAVDFVVVVAIGILTPLPTFSFVLWLVYQVGFWSWRSTTLGGIVFGLRGVRLDGKPMDFGVSLVRHLASYLSGLALMLGFFWAGWDPEGQTWHDKLAGTIVVRVPRGEPLL